MKIIKTFDIPFDKAIEYCSAIDRLCECCLYEADCVKKITSDNLGNPIYLPCSSDKFEDLSKFIDEEQACNIYLSDNYL